MEAGSTGQAHSFRRRSRLTRISSPNTWKYKVRNILPLLGLKTLETDQVSLIPIPPEAPEPAIALGALIPAHGRVRVRIVPEHVDHVAIVIAQDCPLTPSDLKYSDRTETSRDE